MWKGFNMMNIRPIRTERDYEAALKQIEELMDSAQPDSPEEKTLDALATLVERYETQECPISSPDPISALEHYLDRQALKRKDLIPYIGSIGQVHEIMDRHSSLTSSMIRKLGPVTGIPTKTLEQSYELNLYDSHESENTVSQQTEKLNKWAFPIFN